MQYLKQSFFPVHSYNKKREPTKDEAEPRRVVWRGADAYLGRAEGRCLRCRPHCFCSPGYWPGACPRQLWAELISVVREPPPLSTQLPFLCLSPGPFSSSSLTGHAHSLCTEERSCKDTSQPSGSFFISLSEIRPGLSGKGPIVHPSILPVITSNPNTTLLIAS